MRVVTIKSRPWTDNQINTLKYRIAKMMEEDGGVDMSSIAYYCGHSISSCAAKSKALGIEYVIRNKTTPYKLQKIFKGDMRNLPKHKNGRNVDYMQSWRL